VAAARLEEARLALSPKIGTTANTLDQQLLSPAGVSARRSMASGGPGLPPWRTLFDQETTDSRDRPPDHFSTR